MRRRKYNLNELSLVLRIKVHWGQNSLRINMWEIGDFELVEFCDWEIRKRLEKWIGILVWLYFLLWSTQTGLQLCKAVHRHIKVCWQILTINIQINSLKNSTNDSKPMLQIFQINVMCHRSKKAILSVKIRRLEIVRE